MIWGKHDGSAWLIGQGLISDLLSSGLRLSNFDTVSSLNNHGDLNRPKIPGQEGSFPSPCSRFPVS